MNKLIRKMYNTPGSILIQISLVIVLIYSPPIAAVEKIISIDNIQGVVENFISQHIDADDSSVQIDVGRLDPQLRLSSCDHALNAFLPAGHRLYGYTSIGVRCDSPRPWTIYVRARVRRYDNVLVARRAITRGYQLTDADVILERRDLGTLASIPLMNPEHVIGKLARRSIGMGAVLTDNMLKQPMLVRRGQQVTIIAEGPGLSVSASGEALEDGTESDSIRVRNLLTKKVIIAVVSEPGMVRTAP